MREVERLLAEAAEVFPKTVAGTARQILKLKDSLWTFVYIEGVEPTNNLAERDLRHAVIWRKTSFGAQSEDGSRFVERILTALKTYLGAHGATTDFIYTSKLVRLARKDPQ